MANLDKEDYVLLDTGWTFVRKSFFVIGIMKGFPGIKFVICSVFGTVELRNKLIN